MKKKQKTPQEKIEALCEDIRREILHWNHLNEHGGQDPFCSDGVNMNLTRNHVIYDKHQIAEICGESGLELPAEYYQPTPPVVSSDYMANLKQKERVERLTVGGKKLTARKTKYDQDQTSLF